MKEHPCEPFRELSSAALDGRLDAADAARLEQHLTDCAACRSASSAFARQRAELRRAAIPPVADDVVRRLQGALRPARRRFPYFPLLRRAAVLVAVVGLTSWVVELLSRPSEWTGDPAPSVTAEGSEAGQGETLTTEGRSKDLGRLAEDSPGGGVGVDGARQQDAHQEADEKRAPHAGLRRKNAPLVGAPMLTRAFTLPRRTTDDGLSVRFSCEAGLIQERARAESIPEPATPERTLSERELARCNAAVASGARAFESFVADARAAISVIDGAGKPGRGLSVESLDADVPSTKAQLVAKRAVSEPGAVRGSETRRLYVAEGPAAIEAVRALLVQRAEPLQTMETALLAAASRGKLEWTANAVRPQPPQGWEVFLLPPAQRVADEILGAIESLRAVHLRAAEGNPDVGESVIVVLDH